MHHILPKRFNEGLRTVQNTKQLIFCTPTECPMKYVYDMIRFYCGYILGFCGFMWCIFPYSSGLFHWHWGNRMIAPVQVKQPWRIWVKLTITKLQQNTTAREPWSYFWHISYNTKIPGNLVISVGVSFMGSPPIDGAGSNYINHYHVYISYILSKFIMTDIRNSFNASLIM